MEKKLDLKTVNSSSHRKSYFISFLIKLMLGSKMIIIEHE